jgi:hypothetical protein
MPRAKKVYQHPTLMSTADHARLIDAQRLAPPDVIPTLTAADIAAAIRRDSDRKERLSADARRRRKNAENADRGQDVLTYYASLPGMDTDQQTLLTDLLADLMHAAAANRNLRFQSALDSAEGHYTAERNGED